MNKTTSIEITSLYEEPKCAVIEISPEGVLCASMEQLEEVEGEYEW